MRPNSSSMLAASNSQQSQTLIMTVAAAGTLCATSLYFAPSLVVLTACLAAGLYFFGRPFSVLVVLVFLIPFNFVFVVAGVPLAAELLKLAIWVPLLIAHIQGKRFIKSKYAVPLLALAGLLLSSCARAVSLPYTLKEVVRAGSSIGLVFVVINLIDTREKLVIVVRWLVVSSFIVALYGFYQFAIQDFGALFWIVNPRLDTTLAPNRIAFYEWRNRITSVLTSEMELGHYFNYCIPFAASLTLTSATRKQAWGWAGITLSLLVGLLLTFTFGSWIALFTAGSLALIYFRRSLGQWKTLLVLSVAVIMLIAYSSLGDLLRDRIDQVVPDIAGRIAIWDVAVTAIRYHPVFGVGVGNFPALTVDAGFGWLSQDWVAAGTTPHNMYLFMLAEWGIVGTICILSIIVRVIFSMLRLSAESFDPGIRWYSVSIAIVFVTLCIAGLADDSPLFGTHVNGLVWLLVGLSEAMQRICSTSSDKAQVQTTI